MSIFLGVNLKPNRKYVPTTTKSFCLSGLAMDNGTGANLYMTANKQKFLVAAVSKAKPQVNLDLKIGKFDQVALQTTGDATVSLLGYLLKDSEDEDDDDVDELAQLVKRKPKRAKNSQQEHEDDNNEEKEDDSEKEDSESDKPKPKSQPKSKDKKPVMKERTITGGVKIIAGKGAEARAGKCASVNYIGHLQLKNKIVDSQLQVKTFKFPLGAGKAIKGFDVGVAGMKVGGKRRITCPPPMAFGRRGAPPKIPPNSTLVYEVELKAVN